MNRHETLNRILKEECDSVTLINKLIHVEGLLLTTLLTKHSKSTFMQNWVSWTT